MKRILICLIGLSLLAAMVSRAQDAATEERLNRLAGQLEDLQIARTKLEKQMADLLRDLSSLRDQQSQSGTFARQEDVRKLAEKVQEIDQKRVADNEKILKEVERLVRSAPAAGSRPVRVTPDAADRPPTPGTPEKGFEHIVQSGDTISTIALAYREKGIRITTDQILKANPGLVPERMPVGKKIFIPAP